nr:exocyst complex component 4 [Hymenolepis microstoma]
MSYFTGTYLRQRVDERPSYRVSYSISAPSLRSCSSKEVRERKRRLLERDYTETEEVLNVYLNEKYGEVTQILNVYRDVSQNLEKNSKAVQKMKRDIGQCKSLLSFNRDELRRLWLELVEQRRSLELIEVIDRVKSAPEILKNSYCC